jgi:hypothetical protein
MATTVDRGRLPLPTSLRKPANGRHSVIDHRHVWPLAKPCRIFRPKSNDATVPNPLRNPDDVPRPRSASLPIQSLAGKVRRVGHLWPARAALDSCESGWSDSTEVESRLAEALRPPTRLSTGRGRLFTWSWASCEVRQAIRHSGLASCLAVLIAGDMDMLGHVDPGR